LLPSQGPITAFVFLNTLQGLEDLSFDEGVRKGARLFGCQPYLSEERQRQKIARGRIRPEDIRAVVLEDLGERANETVATLNTRLEIRTAMLQYPLRSGPPDELRWFVAETDALNQLREDAPPGIRERFIEETRFWVMRDLRGASEASQAREFKPRDSRLLELLGDIVDRFGVGRMDDWQAKHWEATALQALWRIICRAVQKTPHHDQPHAAPVRHRDLLLAAVGEDSDALVHELLIRFSAAYTDQGLADWQLPCRELGYFRAFCELYRQPGGPPDRWMRGLSSELNRITTAGLSPLESIAESLRMLGVSGEESDDYLTATLLSLRGWAGLLRQMEVRGDRVPLPAPTGTVYEFIAVRLILERFALAFVARNCKLSFSGPLSELRDAARSLIVRHEASSIEQRAFIVFQVAQVLGWHPRLLYRLSDDEWRALLNEVDQFSSIERRRTLHLGFERRFRTQALDAISLHAPRPATTTGTPPRFQAVFCIDAREESFRRHLEEFAPDTETFGAAGFFGVAMYYRGVADAHYSTLCPIVIRPQHWVVEEVVYSLEQEHQRRKKTRKALGTASHQVHVGSRSIARGALLTAGLGVLASVPLIARVLFPRLTARIRQRAGRFVEAPPITRLRLERLAPTPGPEDDQIGFTVEEMANLGERLLRDIGLLSNFSRLVMFIGHGSFCLNNPHKSAYDCGACSGGAGGPNGRALAAMLNDPRVRDILAIRGLKIPRETYFLGGQHNTCNDSVTFFDLDLLPHSHAADFERARQTLEQVCERNAHERCRRFYSAPLNITPAAARRHVEARAEDLAQTRPEFGNASNAMCVVGRRSRTRGLYLDRRSFLVSYDPTVDDEDFNILGRILGAVVPVCEGINLQYFFSYIDSAGWGCGTKLPHNVTSLLGVMDGAASDLRPGLPLQGVEIHEPVRLLFAIESRPEAIFKIMQRNPTVGRIIGNGWVQLALVDPDSSSIQLYRDGRFVPYDPTATELPKASASAEWYRGWREHLAFAELDPNLTNGTGNGNGQGGPVRPTMELVHSEPNLA
ncbi:MAG TPA: DUF2309 domain-containing protein, partial [Pirellulaceae bacterium]|nr:DUF2309 domain-containing protein [Pirellulaceae bacterium]